MVKRPLQRAGGRSGTGSSAMAPAQEPARWGTGWRGACWLYTPQNRSEVTSTHPPLMLIEERNQLKPPRAGQGEKNSWKGYQNHHNGHHCLPALDGGSDNGFEIKSQGQISREMQRRVRLRPQPRNIQFPQGFIMEKGSKTPTQLPRPSLGYCPRPVRSRKSSWLVSKMLPVALSWAGCGEGNGAFISQRNLGEGGRVTSRDLRDAPAGLGFQGAGEAKVHRVV